jgi:hypothetical protein
MLNRTNGLAALVAIALPMLAGCASNSSQVRLRSAQDLDCDAANVHVELTERPYVGVTRYEATGCGASRSYECRARAYVAGVPMGERTCRRTGGPAGPVVSPQGVVF